MSMHLLPPVVQAGLGVVARAKADAASASSSRLASNGSAGERGSESSAANLAVPRAPLLESGFAAGGRLGSLAGSTLHTMANGWYVRDPWVFETMKDRMKTEAAQAAHSDASMDMTALGARAEHTSAARAASQTNRSMARASREGGTGAGGITGLPTMVRDVKAHKPVFGSSTPREFLQTVKQSDAYARDSAPRPPSPITQGGGGLRLQSASTQPRSARNVSSLRALRGGVAHSSAAPGGGARGGSNFGSAAALANASTAVLAGTDDGTQSRSGASTARARLVTTGGGVADDTPPQSPDALVASGRFMPSWVKERPEYAAIEAADTRTLERRVRDALRTAGTRRSASQIAVLTGWLRGHNPHFERMPEQQLTQVARCLTMLQLTPEQQLEMADFDSQPLQTEREGGSSSDMGAPSMQVGRASAGLSKPPQLTEFGNAVSARGGMMFFLLSGTLLVLRGLMVTTVGVGDYVGTPPWVALLTADVSKRNKLQARRKANAEKLLRDPASCGSVLSAVGAEPVPVTSLSRGLQIAAMAATIPPGLMPVAEARRVAAEALQALYSERAAEFGLHLGSPAPLSASPRTAQQQQQLSGGPPVHIPQLKLHDLSSGEIAVMALGEGGRHGHASPPPSTSPKANRLQSILQRSLGTGAIAGLGMGMGSKGGAHGEGGGDGTGSIWHEVFRAAAANVRFEDGKRYSQVQISSTFAVGTSQLPTVVAVPPPAEGSVASAAASALLSKQTSMAATARNKKGNRNTASIYAAKRSSNRDIDRAALTSMIESANGESQDMRATLSRGASRSEHESSRQHVSRASRRTAGSSHVDEGDSGSEGGEGGGQFDLATTLGVTLVRLSMADYERAVIQEHQRRSRNIAAWLHEHLPVFSAWPRAKLLSLARQFEVQEFKTGEVVFRQGDPVDNLFLLWSGAVEITATVPVRVLHAVPAHSCGEASKLRPVASQASLDTYAEHLEGASEHVQQYAAEDRQRRKSERKLGHEDASGGLACALKPPPTVLSAGSKYSLWSRHMSVRVRRAAAGEWFGEEASHAIRSALTSAEKWEGGDAGLVTPPSAAPKGGVLSNPDGEGDDEGAPSMYSASMESGGADGPTFTQRRHRAVDSTVLPVGQGRWPLRLDDSGRLIIRGFDASRPFTAVAAEPCSVLRLSIRALHKLIYDAASLVRVDGEGGADGGGLGKIQALSRGAGKALFAKAAQAADRLARDEGFKGGSNSTGAPSFDAEAGGDLPDPLYLLFALQYAADSAPTNESLAQEFVRNSIFAAKGQADTWEQLGGRYVRRLARGGREPIGVHAAAPGQEAHAEQPKPVLPDGVGGFGSTAARTAPSLVFRDVVGTLAADDETQAAAGEAVLQIKQHRITERVSLAALHTLPVSSFAHPASQYCSAVSRVSGLPGAGIDEPPPAAALGTPSSAPPALQPGTVTNTSGTQSSAVLSSASQSSVSGKAAALQPTPPRIGAARPPSLQRLAAGVDARSVAHAIARQGSKVGAAGDTRSLTGKIVVDQTRDEGVTAMRRSHSTWHAGGGATLGSQEDSLYFATPAASVRPESSLYNPRAAVAQSARRGKRSQAAHSELSASARIARLQIPGAGRGGISAYDEDPIRSIVPRLLGGRKGDQEGVGSATGHVAPESGSVRRRAAELQQEQAVLHLDGVPKYFDGSGLRRQMGQLTDDAFGRLFDGVATRLRAAEKRITARLYDDLVDRVQYTGYERDGMQGGFESTVEQAGL